MPETNENRQERRLRVHTTRGCLEGSIRTSPVVRTLDDLNLVARRFVTLYEARALSGEWLLESGVVALAKPAILLVFELDEPAPQSRSVKDGARFFRSPIRLWLPDFSVRGFVHVPGGGSAMARFNQQSHPFIAVTSASVVGPQTELAVPFLAVNREHIIAAEEMHEKDPIDDEQSEPAVAFEVMGTDE